MGAHQQQRLGSSNSNVRAHSRRGATWVAGGRTSLVDRRPKSTTASWRTSRRVHMGHGRTRPQPELRRGDGDDDVGWQRGIPEADAPAEYGTWTTVRTELGSMQTYDDGNWPGVDWCRRDVTPGGDVLELRRSLCLPTTTPSTCYLIFPFSNAIAKAGRVYSIHSWFVKCHEVYNSGSVIELSQLSIQRIAALFIPHACHG